MTRPVVLVAIKGMGLGGAEMLIAESARFWDRTRFDYRVVYALPWKDQLVPQLVELDVPVACIGSKRGLTPASWWRLRQEIANSDASLVHAHLPAMGAVARIVSPVPVVYTEHNIASSYRRPVQLVNKLTYARNRSVTAVSEAVAASIAGYPGPRARVVANGVSVAVGDTEVDAVRSGLGIAANSPLVVHVGNIRPHKGHMNLIAATKELANLIPDVLVVSIGGEKNDGDLARVRDAAESAGVSENLRFLGRRSDALAFTAAADVFANPSDFEGLPVAILESMALGTPVVATSVGGVPTVIRNEETGILVAPKDPIGLATGVARVFSDNTAAAEYAAAAKQLVEAEYSLEAMVRTMETMYAAVIDA